MLVDLDFKNIKALIMLNSDSGVNNQMTSLGIKFMMLEGNYFGV